jgi:hypothetical protein
MLNVIYVESRKQALFAECHYAECRYAECHGAVLITAPLTATVQATKANAMLALTLCVTHYR